MQHAGSSFAGLSPQVAAALRDAAGLMNQRRFGEARRLLEPAARARPDLADARYLLGAALRMLGESDGAEGELRAALELEPHRHDAALDLARVLLASGQAEQALEVTERAAQAPRPREAVLIERARAFQALNRMDDCVAVRERISALQPGKARPLHNLAAALGDAGEAGRAEAAARAAVALGGDEPETWLVLARALQAQGRYDEAEAAFGEAVGRRPAYVDALRDLAQLTWMRTGDQAAAAAVLDRAIAGETGPARGQLRAVRARLREYAGDPRGGYEELVAGGTVGDPWLEVAAAHLAMGFDAQAALGHAERAAVLAPESDAIQRKLIDALLAAGRPETALARVETRLAAQPLDQGLIAAQWTAWRLLGDPRAAGLYDYEGLVSAETIDTPAGWSRLEDYLSDLTAALRELHTLRAHPLDQSLRHGTQTGANLLRLDDPVIRAFREAVDGPVRRKLARLGQGGDRVRARNTGGYRISGLWSVRLRPEGFHTDHVHPMGWLSSACYITLPPAVEAGGQDGGRQGWLKFGEPGTPTAPGLAPEYFVQPRPGLLALFPSYMWHGTVPFPEGERLTMAFDVIPA